jgi:hypothetical protein
LACGEFARQEQERVLIDDLRIVGRMDPVDARRPQLELDVRVLPDAVHAGEVLAEALVAPRGGDFLRTIDALPLGVRRSAHLDLPGDDLVGRDEQGDEVSVDGNDHGVSWLN